MASVNYNAVASGVDTCGRINCITIVHKYTGLPSAFSYMQFAENNSVKPAKQFFSRSANQRWPRGQRAGSVALLTTQQWLRLLSEARTPALLALPIKITTCARP